MAKDKAGSPRTPQEILRGVSREQMEAIASLAAEMAREKTGEFPVPSELGRPRAHFFDPVLEYFLRSELEKLEGRLKLHVEAELRSQLRWIVGFFISGLAANTAIFVWIVKIILQPPAVEKAAALLSVFS